MRCCYCLAKPGPDPSIHLCLQPLHPPPPTPPPPSTPVPHAPGHRCLPLAEILWGQGALRRNRSAATAGAGAGWVGCAGGGGGSSSTPARTLERPLSSYKQASHPPCCPFTSPDDIPPPLPPSHLPAGCALVQPLLPRAIHKCGGRGAAHLGRRRPARQQRQRRRQQQQQPQRWWQGRQRERCLLQQSGRWAEQVVGWGGRTPSMRRAGCMSQRGSAHAYGQRGCSTEPPPGSSAEAEIAVKVLRRLLEQDPELRSVALLSPYRCVGTLCGQIVCMGGARLGWHVHLRGAARQKGHFRASVAHRQPACLPVAPAPPPIASIALHCSGQVRLLSELLAGADLPAGGSSSDTEDPAGGGGGAWQGGCTSHCASPGELAAEHALVTSAARRHCPRAQALARVPALLCS